MSDNDDDSVEVGLESLLPVVRPEEEAIRVKIGAETFVITQKAKQSMAYSVDAMANQPTIFYKMDFIIQAVADTLNIDKLTLSFPHTKEELEAVDWDDVIPGYPDTYLKGADPPKSQWRRVKACHTVVKEERDASARVAGLPKSGVQAWSTYTQRWREWRHLCAAYQSMYPDETLQMVYDRIKGETKMMTSLDKIYSQAVSVAMKKHIDKLKRGDRKRQEAEAVMEATEKSKQDKEKAEAEAAKQAAEEERLQQQKLTIKSTVFSKNRKQNTAQKKQALEQQKCDAIKAAKKRKEAAEEAKALAKELKALQKQKEEIDELETEDETEIKKPKFKRNDISMLDLDVIPSKKVELDGVAWKPPMRTQGGKKGTVAYDPPGGSWKEDSSRKLYLLFAMSRELKAQGLIPPPMTFATLMEFIEGRCGYTLEFSGRVFIYLIALILNQKM